MAGGLGSVAPLLWGGWTVLKQSTSLTTVSTRLQDPAFLWRPPQCLQC